MSCASLRRWLLNTIEFKGENGTVKEAVVEEINWQKAENGRLTMVGTGKTETIRADIVFLALGFATGDAVMGASLVVKAIASGRKVAECVHQMLIEEKD